MHPPTDLSRFWQMMDASAGPEKCWPWQGAFFGRTGYGSVQVDRRARGAHRVAWQIHNGRQLRPSEVVCHSCDNRACCNPAHLWVGSQRDNVQDMIGKGRAEGAGHRNTLKTHCPRGHAYDAAGQRGNGDVFRVCSICSAAQKLAWKRRQRSTSAHVAESAPCREPKKGYAR